MPQIEGYFTKGNHNGVSGGTSGNVKSSTYNNARRLLAYNQKFHFQLLYGLDLTRFDFT
jgi:hypothetical protein